MRDYALIFSVFLLAACSSNSPRVSNSNPQEPADGAENYVDPDTLQLDLEPEEEPRLEQDFGLRQSSDTQNDTPIDAGSSDHFDLVLDHETDLALDETLDPARDASTDNRSEEDPDLTLDHVPDVGIDATADVRSDSDAEMVADVVLDRTPDVELDAPSDSGRELEIEVSPPTCESYLEPESVGTLPPVVDEASGLAVSSFDETILWTHNDSGGRSEVYAFNETGELLATVSLAGASFRDWEDMAGAPCPDDSGEHCLYVGDIGDNIRVRSTIAVHSFREPDPRDGDAIIDDFLSVELTYPDGAQNSEAMVVDSSGRVFLLTKVWGTSQLFSTDFVDGELELVTTIQMDTAIGYVTAADLSQDGSRLLIRSYSNAAEYRIDEGGLELLHEAEAAVVPTRAERQGESIAYGPNGDYWHVSEGDEPAIYHVRCATE